jgi:hypothetical protein
MKTFFHQGSRMPDGHDGILKGYHERLSNASDPLFFRITPHVFMKFLKLEDINLCTYEKISFGFIPWGFSDFLL